MPRGRKYELTLAEEQMVKDAWAQVGNMHATAKMTGIPYNVVKRFHDEHRQELLNLRAKNAADIVPTMEMVRRLALEELTNPARIAAAKTQDLAIIIGILTDKINVIMGQPTARLVIQKLSAEAVSHFSPEEREKIRQLRDKMLADGAPREVVDGVASKIT